MLLFSFWVPQVLHLFYDFISVRLIFEICCCAQVIFNVVKNSSPLENEFTVGTSLVRLFVPMYVYGCPDNLVSNRPDPSFCVLVTGWVGLQLITLHIQTKKGPRFFVPKRFLPVGFDYHRTMLRSVTVDAGDEMELSTLIQRDAERGEETKQDEDSEEEDCCPICCCELEQEDPLLIMTTPCNHQFHTECLRQWMEQKMECPTCRFSPLPSYD